MSNVTINRAVWTDESWWHWLITIPLLGISLAGYSWGICAAMVLCAVVGVHFFLRIRRVAPFPVQVRIAYLGLLAVGTLPWMEWVHWVQLVGTTAMVTVGYCPLIRMLRLLPFNRNESLTVALIWRVFVRDPCAGGLVQWSTNSATTAIGCCSPSAENSLSCSAPPRPSRQKEASLAQTH